MTPEEMQTDEAAAKKLIVLDGLRKRLMEVTGLLVGQVPTSLRVVLERYYPLMRKSRAYEGTSNFPKSLARTGRNKERTLARMKGDVLCFHLGNAILAYYEDDAALMEYQVQLLEDVALRTYAYCRVVGTDAVGYTMTIKSIEQEEKEKKAALEEAKKHVRVPPAKKP